jgi:hypothetical protein
VWNQWKGGGGGGSRSGTDSTRPCVLLMKCPSHITDEGRLMGGEGGWLTRIHQQLSLFVLMVCILLITIGPKIGELE